jgi:hypothetical protein
MKIGYREGAQSITNVFVDHHVALIAKFSEPSVSHEFPRGGHILTLLPSGRDVLIKPQATVSFLQQIPLKITKSLV